MLYITKISENKFQKIVIFEIKKKKKNFFMTDVAEQFVIRCT